MSGKIIELRMSQGQVPPEKSKIIYINDFMFGNNPWKRPKKPLREVTIGMDKINAKTMMGKYWVHYANTCTIHGINHLTAPRRHILERVITVVALIAALSALIVLSLVFWTRYQTAAAITIVDHNFRKFRITKPSIYVCPEPSVDYSKFPEVFAKYYVDNTLEARHFFTVISNVPYTMWHTIPNYQDVDPDLWVPILNELKPDLKLDTNFNSTGKWTITEVGFCMAFNNYASIYSNYEYWRSDNWTIVPPPLKWPEIGFKKWEVSDSIKVYNHSSIRYSLVYPGDVLNFMEHERFKAPAKSVMRMDLVPAEIVALKEVQELTVSQRSCMFPNERHLKTFPIYSESMCFMECRYDLMKEFCGCYPHFVRPTSGVPTCNVRQLRCISKHLSNILYVKGDLGETCGCLGDCKTTRYTPDYFLPTYLKSGSPNDTVIVVGAILPLDRFIRTQIFGFNDFLVSVGGAAGLFLGASILSFAEFFYFATLRLFWFLIDIRRMKKKEERKKERLMTIQKISLGYQKTSGHGKSSLE